MTTRDRLEAKKDRRLEWAEKADARSEAAASRASAIADRSPLGQPILVGHHSERHARRDAERIRSGFDRACEAARLAEHHRQRAEGLERALGRSIFSDDVDAVSSLEARIAERTAKLERMKALNKAFRSDTSWELLASSAPARVERLAALVANGAITRAEALDIAHHWTICPHETQPYPAYAITNLRADITRNAKRLGEVKARQQRTDAAESAPGGLTVEDLGNGHTRVTFAEKPAREVLEALRVAGYRWGQGSWTGPSASLPEGIR